MKFQFSQVSNDFKFSQVRMFMLVLIVLRKRNETTFVKSSFYDCYVNAKQTNRLNFFRRLIFSVCSNNFKGIIHILLFSGR